MPSLLDGLPLAREAYGYACECHGGQRRDSDAAPFIAHPLEVAALLVNTGHPEPVVAAGILHDVVEDTDARLEDVRERFGDEVAGIVGAVTEDASISDYEPRKAALRRSMAAGGPAAWAVYAADKVAKARELRAELARRGPAVTAGTAERRRAHYWASVEALERVAPIGPLVRQLRFELELLDAAPPG